MQLQDRLDAFTNKMAASGRLPEPVAARLQESIREQIAGSQADRALKAGERAPVFALDDANAVKVDSAALLGKGPLVVTFYRGVWRPYCNIELQAREEARGEIEARGATVVAVSMQNTAHSRKTARENKIGFPIMIDIGGKVAAAFGLRHQLSPKMIELHRSLGSDLALINGEDSWTLPLPLPLPGRYLIGQDGIVAYAEVNPDYTKRPDPSELFPVLDHLARARARAA